MATNMITLKLEKGFLVDIDSIVEKEGYQNRKEFIRNAVREKLEEVKLKQAMTALAKLKGMSKKKTGLKDYEQARKKAFENICSRIK